ncbi:MAG: hypothetical protein KBT03_13480 [Bacteroidales bacterium]|nr:hypothetical protein [Candidatus Scybalousia scybalohippi]
MAKRFNTVAKFAQTENGNKLVTMMEDYASQYVSEKVEGVKLSYDTKYTMAEKAKKINDAYIAELARRSKYSREDFDTVEDYANFGAVAQMGAQIQKAMLDAVTPILINATGLSMLAEFHYGGYGDVFEFEDKDNSVYEVSRMGRRQKHTKTQERKKNNKTISTEFYGLSTYSTLPQILLGDAMIAEDTMLMALSMNKKIYTLVLNKFVSAVNAITDTKMIMTGYTEKGFLQKLRYGSAKNGAKMAIVGDNVALKDILPADARTRILLQDEYNTTLGYMSSWNGYNALGFDVVADDDQASGVLGLPINRVYGLPVTGSKLIHVAIGTTMSNADDPMDNDNLVAINTFRKELGVELCTNLKVVRVDL